jgi:hypothetical protein
MIASARKTRGHPITDDNEADALALLTSSLTPEG